MLIRILLAHVLFYEKGKSLNFLSSNSNSNFPAIRVIFEKWKSLNFLNSNSNSNYAGTDVI